MYPPLFLSSSIVAICACSSLFFASRSLHLFSRFSRCPRYKPVRFRVPFLGAQYQPVQLSGISDLSSCTLYGSAYKASSPRAIHRSGSSEPVLCSALATSTHGSQPHLATIARLSSPRRGRKSLPHDPCKLVRIPRRRSIAGHVLLHIRRL